MAVTTKGKALMDSHMSRQSMIRAADAVTKDYKSFRIVFDGSLNEGKHVKKGKDIVSVIKKTITALRTKDKKIEQVKVKFTIRDSSTLFNYGDYSARYEQIKQELRDWLGDAVSLHPDITHEKSYDFQVLIEGSVGEKEFWQ